MKWFLVIVCSGLFQLSFAQDWKLTKKKDSVTVYTRSIEGFETKQFKATTTINRARLHSVAAIIMDAEHTENWIADVEKGDFLAQPNDTNWISYLLLTLPWPFDNRELILDNFLSQDEKGIVTIKLSSHHDHIPLNDKYVRIIKAEGYWQLIETANGVEVEYVFVGETAGNIPQWLVNLFVVDGPITTMSNIREQCFEEPYKSANLYFLKSSNK